MSFLPLSTALQQVRRGRLRSLAVVHGAAVAVLKRPEAAKRLDDLGFTPVGDQPEVVGSYVRSEIDRLDKLIRAFNLTAE